MFSFERNMNCIFRYKASLSPKITPKVTFKLYYKWRSWFLCLWRWKIYTKHKKEVQLDVSFLEYFLVKIAHILLEIIIFYIVCTWKIVVLFPSYMLNSFIQFLNNTFTFKISCIQICSVLYVCKWWTYILYLWSKALLLLFQMLNVCSENTQKLIFAVRTSSLRT